MEHTNLKPAHLLIAVALITVYGCQDELGCTDESAENFNIDANVDDGSCIYVNDDTTEIDCIEPEFDGYVYSVVQIGSQCWFAENLRTSKYANGDDVFHPIPEEWEFDISSPTLQGSTIIYGENGADCTETAPDFDACDSDISLQEYGRLYNKVAVLDERGICPTGWHIPSSVEVTELEEYLIAAGYDAGLALKSVNGWESEWGGGEDTFGFGAKPGGDVVNTGVFQFSEAGYKGTWWSVESHFSLTNGNDGLFNGGISLSTNAKSVRCLKD